MSEPIVECMYGWGKVMRLYDDHLDANGSFYALVELISVCPIYHHIMGVDSARLELCFQRRKVVLRGIAAIGEAERAVIYLSERYMIGIVTDKHCSISLPRIDHSQEPVSTYERRWQTEDLCLSLDERSLQLHSTNVQDTEGYMLGEYSRTATAPIKLSPRQMIRYEKRARKLKHAQAERAKREHGFDVELLAIRLQARLLPQVYVPIRLLAGEHAHYCTDATLCEEPLPASIQGNYRVKDQGLLILTSKRMIYIGRKRQLVLGYGHFMHISRLRGAIAVLSDTWSKREIFEVRFPLECTMYLDAILLHFRQQEQSMPGEKQQVRVRRLYPDKTVYPYHMPITRLQSETTHQQSPDPYSGVE